MSYLDKFLIESSNRQHGSIESEEGDVEDNRAPSVASSKSNLSELSIVSITAVERKSNAFCVDALYELSY